VPKKTLGKGSVTVTWRRDGDFSLPSVKWHSANSLPSARQKILGKEAVADVQFAERSLPSVTLGKAFAECKLAFAECLRHSAKELCPVVYEEERRGWGQTRNRKFLETPTNLITQQYLTSKLMVFFIDINDILICTSRMIPAGRSNWPGGGTTTMGGPTRKV
jgi:hypothetical protein